MLNSPGRGRTTFRPVSAAPRPLALVAAVLGWAGCVAHGAKPGSPAPNAAPTSSAPPALTACEQDSLPAARVWRLTHAQLRNTLQDLAGYVGPAVDTLPPDARLEGFANGADRLGIPPLLMEYYFKASDEVS